MRCRCPLSPGGLICEARTGSSRRAVLFQRSRCSVRVSHNSRCYHPAGKYRISSTDSKACFSYSCPDGSSARSQTLHTCVQASLAGSPAMSVALVPVGDVPRQPYPHCQLPAAQHGASAATSVEAMQQSSGDNDLNGAVTYPSSQAGATSMPSAHSSKRQRPPSLGAVSRLPATPVLRRLLPAIADQQPLERGHFVVHDNSSQAAAPSPPSQQVSELPAKSHKRAKHGSHIGRTAQHSRSATVQSFEHSGGSPGRPQAAQQLCQAAHGNSQQGTFEEVSLCMVLVAL